MRFKNHDDGYGYDERHARHVPYVHVHKIQWLIVERDCDCREEKHRAEILFYKFGSQVQKTCGPFFAKTIYPAGKSARKRSRFGGAPVTARK